MAPEPRTAARDSSNDRPSANDWHVPRAATSSPSSARTCRPQVTAMACGGAARDQGLRFAVHATELPVADAVTLGERLEHPLTGGLRQQQAAEQPFTARRRAVEVGGGRLERGRYVFQPVQVNMRIDRPAARLRSIPELGDRMHCWFESTRNDETQFSKSILPCPGPSFLTCIPILHLRVTL